MYRALKLLSRRDSGELVYPGEVVDLSGLEPGDIARLIECGAVEQINDQWEVDDGTSDGANVLDGREN